MARVKFDMDIGVDNLFEVFEAVKAMVDAGEKYTDTRFDIRVVEISEEE